MSLSQLYFNQDCPVCGRGMRVRVELLGREIACGHCSAVSLASNVPDHHWRSEPVMARLERTSHQDKNLRFADDSFGTKLAVW